MEREDIYILNRHSELTETSVSKALEEKVYNNPENWSRFLQIFLLSLGIGFTVAGIICFFAYNWDELNKFVKIGLVEALLIAATLLALLPKLSLVVRNTILTGSAVLIGVLFAVYGQIYQTGANAYNFFLVWTIFVTLWAFATNFAPLWFIWMVLLNTTVILYSKQVAQGWSAEVLCLLLASMNGVLLLAGLFLTQIVIPLKNLVALAIVIFLTVGISVGIHNPISMALILLVLLASLLYYLAILDSFKKKNSYYLTLIPFSCMICLINLFMRDNFGTVVFFIVSLFTVFCTTLTIKWLLSLHKKWNNEQ